MMIFLRPGFFTASTTRASSQVLMNVRSIGFCSGNTSCSGLMSLPPRSSNTVVRMVGTLKTFAVLFIERCRDWKEASGVTRLGALFLVAGWGSAAGWGNNEPVTRPAGLGPCLHCSKRQPSFDHSVGLGEYHRGQLDAEGLCSFQVDCKVELHWLLYRQ